MSAVSVTLKPRAWAEQQLRPLQGGQLLGWGLGGGKIGNEGLGAGERRVRVHRIETEDYEYACPARRVSNCVLMRAHSEPK